MRTLGKTLEYLLVTGLLLVVAYTFIAPVARGVAASFNHTANLIADPNKELGQ